MKVISLDDNVKLKNTVVTVGKFDGIHRGHEKLFEVMKKEAPGSEKVVLTFESSPKEFLEGSPNKCIVSREEKRLLCEQMGIDVFITMPLKEEFLKMTPDEFVRKILIGKVGATKLVCGTDFRFGKNAAGDASFIEDNYDKYGIKVSKVEKEKYNDREISSTDIRSMISKGYVGEANYMLGHPYCIVGKVSSGKQLGTKMGLPTANIIPQSDKLLPPFGVYKTMTEIDGKLYRSITNIGNNPTVTDDKSVKVETNIFDFDGTIYDKIIFVNFYRFVRKEKKFNSIEELKEQIKKDIEECK